MSTNSPFTSLTLCGLICRRLSGTGWTSTGPRWDTKSTMSRTRRRSTPCSQTPCTRLGVIIKRRKNEKMNDLILTKLIRFSPDSLAGHIRSVEAIKDIKRGEEILCNYGYDENSILPDWYKEHEGKKA